MNKEFCTYEQALALKELGFDEPCLSYYDGETLFKFPGDGLSNRNFSDLFTVTTPLYQQAFRWFREKYKLHACIHSDYSWNISGGIWDLGGHIGSRYDWDSDTYITYEEAEQECLDKLIEIVKNK